MNFECHGNNVGYKAFLCLCEDLHVVRADKVCGSNIDFTYFQESTLHSSVIDHILSDAITNFVHSYSLCEDIVNLSDHFCVVCSVKSSLMNGCNCNSTKKC